MHTKRAAKKSGKLRKLRRGFILLVLLIAIVVLVIYTLNSVGPVIVSVSEARIRALTTSAVNSAIFEVMTEPTKYSELITIQKDDAGNITLIEANAMVINNLAREMAKQTETYMEAIGEQVIKIPVGTLSGSPLLAGKGPKVTVKVVPVGSVKCHFVSEFEEAGINQSRHKIYLDIITNVSIILPTSQTTVKTNTPVLVCESIIVGKVPDTYFNVGSIGGSNLDLLP